MALEDIAMFRAVPDSTVLVTSDANQTAALAEALLDRSGVVYLRTSRMATPVICAPGEREQSVAHGYRRVGVVGE